MSSAAVDAWEAERARHAEVVAHLRERLARVERFADLLDENGQRLAATELRRILRGAG